MNIDRRNHDLCYLRAAARLALRGHGGAEPNPLVGCVIVSSRGQVVGWGYHRHCGGPHAEIVALQRTGDRAKNATLYCTLEPCNHTGRTRPCTDAIIHAGIKRVVIARRDPNQIAAGGLDRLKAAGIAVEINDRCQQAIAVSDPFVHRVTTGLPWVIVKWAQTIDGRIATRNGQSQWISNAVSRKLVHRERGRVDAILTGIGTVLRDDPMLTARNVRTRRLARRIVIDPRLEIPLAAKLITTTSIAPTTIVCDQSVVDSSQDRARQLRDKGVEVLGIGTQNGCLPLGTILRQLVKKHDMSNLMVEAGPGLISRLFQQRLVNEAWVFIAPLLLGDEQAKTLLTGMAATTLTDSMAMELRSVRQRSGDVILRYRVI